jgi:hypothetical protein
MGAERIISAGVFTRENDQSFIAQGVAELGAVVVGPTQLGPAFVPTRISSYSEFAAKFGSLTVDTYVPNLVKDYLSNASSVIVTRVLGNGGWSFTASRKLAAIVTGSTILAVFHPSKNASPNSLGLELSSITSSTGTPSGSITGSFVLTLTGSGFASATRVSASLLASSPNFITKTLGSNEFNSLATGSYVLTTAFPLILFKELANSASLSASVISLATSSVAFDFTSSFAEGYDAAKTPFITDGATSNPKNLFRFVHLSHGLATNKDLYVSINGLIEPADVNGVEQYSTFNVIVRDFGDSDKQPSVLEQYNNVNLDPNSPNFIAKVIGDRYFEYSSTLQKVNTKGNYPNVSKYIRVEMSDNFNPELTVSSLSVKAGPHGFKKLDQTIIGFTGFNLPGVIYKVTQSIDGAYSSRAYLGFDMSLQDNLNYLNPVPTIAGVSSGSVGIDFSVNNYFGHPSATWTGSLSASVDVSGIAGPLPSQVQFNVPFQGGTDGINPATIRRMGNDIAASNAFGYDLSASTTAGAVAFNKAIDILSNADEYDFNLLAIPGVLASLHGSVTNYATSMVENRGDAFYVLDLNNQDSSVASAVAVTAGLTSNYVGTYYPWVKINDVSTGRPTFVPPSTIVLGAFANNDRVAAPWFAVGGLNRGGLGAVIEAKNKLSQAERDNLYTNRINPIATFPGTGVSIHGQKTLQVKSTAFDRINVRRLLIDIKKFVASTSRFLVFEQNTAVTRNRFLNLVTPYLESVQQRQGLYGFRVVMDDTNNTAEVIDRNQLVGQIYLQPTKTAEFIILDFNVLPTGATFPTA